MGDTETLQQVRAAFNQHRVFAVTGDKAGAIRKWDELVHLLNGDDPVWGNPEKPGDGA
jgi:hypothetical protein